MKKFTKILSLILILTMLAGIMVGCTEEEVNAVVDIADSLSQLLEEPESSSAQEPQDEAVPAVPDDAGDRLDEDASYTTKEDVSLYIHSYGKLPSNFITKKEAQEAGWPGGSLEPYLPGMCIGGDRFGNREGLLPSADGRTWTECDINTLGQSSRGAERIVFSNDGLIYYTGDHYESFELLFD